MHIEDKKTRNMDRQGELSYLQLQLKKSIELKDEREQFRLLNKFIKLSSFYELNEIDQVLYCRLLKFRGNVNRSIALLEDIMRKSDYKAPINVKLQLIQNYLYVNDYDKAEQLLNNCFYANAENKDKMMYQTIVQEGYNKHWVVAALEIARHNNYIYPSVKRKSLSYYAFQIMYYDIEHTRSYMYKYFLENQGNHLFDESCSIDHLIELSRQLLPSAVKSTDSSAVDYYYFNLGQYVGRSVDGQPLTGIRVVTLKNSQDIINIEPYDVNDEKKIRIINSVSIPSKEERIPHNKEKRKSQIERFNARYHKNSE